MVSAEQALHAMLWLEPRTATIERRQRYGAGPWRILRSGASWRLSHRLGGRWTDVASGTAERVYEAASRTGLASALRQADELWYRVKAQRITEAAKAAGIEKQSPGHRASITTTAPTCATWRNS